MLLNAISRILSSPIRLRSYIYPGRAEPIAPRLLLQPAQRGADSRSLWFMLSSGNEPYGSA